VTRLLLDTMFLIDAERRTIDLDEAIDDQDDVAIAAVTVAELRVGALLADRRRVSTRTAFVDEIVARPFRSSPTTRTWPKRTRSSWRRSARKAGRAERTTSSSPRPPGPSIVSS
jgi:predicted nucleic acid-binding protein